MLSARSTPDALERGAARLASRHISRRIPRLALADVAYTLQAGRKAFAHRRRSWWRATTPRRSAPLRAPRRRPRRRPARGRAQPPAVAFMFPGQGAQYVRHGAALYADEPVFRAAVDRCAERAAAASLGFDLRERALPDGRGTWRRRPRRCEATALTQPALFAIEYALGPPAGCTGASCPRP